MLIKPLLTPTISLEQCAHRTDATSTLQQRINHRHQQSKNYKLRHEDGLTNCYHRPQRHRLFDWQFLQKQRQQRCILLLIALMLLQQFELHACRQLAQRSSQRLASDWPTDESRDSSASDLPNQARNFDLQQSKRSTLRQGTHVGQPEEIFAVDDRMESNYDEYPMIVPKRAALLLDRLMVALHNALEKDRETEQRRIGELNQKHKYGKETDAVNEGDQADLEAGGTQLENMYGDDPAVMMDYDFKDLNSINRATGETFFGKNLQRRAKMGNGEGMALVASSLATGATARSTGKLLSSAGGGGGDGGGGGGGGGGRMNTGRIYWRCYFNAISCF